MLVVALGVALGVASLVLDIDLAWGWMLFILLLLAAANVLTHMRVRRPGPIPESEVFFQLLFDVGALSGLLYLSGGSTNPFVSLYLLPLVIAATTLPGRYAWAMAAVTATCYGLLFFFYVPFMEVHATHDGPGFQLHLVGMWINFVLSGIIASSWRAWPGPFACATPSSRGTRSRHCAMSASSPSAHWRPAPPMSWARRCQQWR